MKTIILIKKIICFIKIVLSVKSKLKIHLREVNFGRFFGFYNEKFNSAELVEKIYSSKNFELKAVAPLYEENSELTQALSLKEFIPLRKISQKMADFYLIWGISPERDFSETILNYAKLNKKPCLIAEDGFIRSVETWANKECSDELKVAVSFTLDDKSSYYDGNKPTRLENMLNFQDITQEDIARSKKIIKFITDNHITKYNHQPIFTPNIGTEGRKKVLVVDQSYGDYSIKKGLACEKTFEDMLKSAIAENPDADILVKTHPDTFTGTRGGYYTDLVQEGRIYPVKFKINPISLINYVDKVYVVSSQFGFEALMCNKDVVCFGLPFYSNWGLTDDRIKCKRRNRKRTTEELFAIAYLKYSLYVNPETAKRCEIEEAIDYILKKRTEFFQNNKELST